MFLQLAHKQLDIYKASKSLVLACYQLTKCLPIDERFNMVQQIRRAALSIQLNIAEGSSRISSAERSRFFEIARGSVIEIDAALDIAVELNYFKKEEHQNLGELIVRCFQMLTKMLNHQKV